MNRLNKISVKKISRTFLWSGAGVTWPAALKIIGKCKHLSIANIFLITKEKGGRLVLSDIKIYCNAKVDKLKCGIFLR